MESTIQIKASRKKMLEEFNTSSPDSNYLIKYFERTGTDTYHVVLRHNELPEKLSGTFTFSSLKKIFKTTK